MRDQDYDKNSHNCYQEEIQDQVILPTEETGFGELKKGVEQL